jgi:hypothetical protein
MQGSAGREPAFDPPGADIARRPPCEPAEYHVSWGPGHGATFVVQGEFSWRRYETWYDEGIRIHDQGYRKEQMICQQALGELLVALGEEPPHDITYECPRPSSMPSFSWTPPLPKVLPMADPDRSGATSTAGLWLPLTPWHEQRNEIHVRWMGHRGRKFAPSRGQIQRHDDGTIRGWRSWLLGDQPRLGSLTRGSEWETPVSREQSVTLGAAGSCQQTARAVCTHFRRPSLLSST